MILALLVLGGAATPPGAAAVGATQRFLAFYAGVCALVGLSITVMVGLAATERTLLGIKYRVFAQSIHRAASVASLAFLVAHIFVKVLAGHSSVATIVVVRANSVGMGTLAFELYVVIFVTGVARAWFASGRRPWLWRGLHALAYLCWPIALEHGLTAGRPAAGWVQWGYALSLVAVGLAVLARILTTVRPGAHLLADEPELDSGFVEQPVADRTRGTVRS
jgi:predicted ferric reductase